MSGLEDLRRIGPHASTPISPSTCSNCLADWGKCMKPVSPEEVAAALPDEVLAQEVQRRGYRLVTERLSTFEGYMNGGER